MSSTYVHVGFYLDKMKNSNFGEIPCNLLLPQFPFNHTNLKFVNLKKKLFLLFI